MTVSGGPTLFGVDVLWVATILSAVAAMAVIFAIYAAVTVRDPMAKRVKSLNKRREQLKAGIMASTTKKRAKLVQQSLLSWLKSHAAQSKVYVVANKVQTSNLEIGRQDFEGSIERKIDVLIPYDPRTAAQSAKLGQALVQAGKSSKASAKIIELTNLVLGSASGGEDAGALGDSKSLLEKFGNLKSLLPSKKAKEDAPQA